jgi:hypothetical protein
VDARAPMPQIRRVDPSSPGIEHGEGDRSGGGGSGNTESTSRSEQSGWGVLDQTGAPFF